MQKNTMKKGMARLLTAGKGSYGIVYVATDPANVGHRKIKKDIKPDGIPEDQLYAVKRNFKEKPTAGYGNLREANMMRILSDHPYIVKLLSIEHEDPFKNSCRPMTPVANLKKDFSDMVEDKMNFVMEYLPYNGEEYIEKGPRTPFSVKVLAMQLLLAVEFMHSRGVVHRDIRTTNVLISVDKEGDHKLKLCDFGLSRVMGDGCATPGVTTSWYRAPDVCCRTKYTKKADIWSVGCVIYELISRKPLLNGVPDDDTKIFNAILSKLPTKPSRKVIEKLFAGGRRLNFESKAGQITRKTWVERMNLSASFKKEFESVEGSLDELEDLLQGMLCLDPDERFTATEALNHPFFNWTRDHIMEIRRDFPPEPPPLPFYTILPCIERKWMADLAFEIFDSISKMDEKLYTSDREEVDPSYLPKKIKKWYDHHRIIFHAIDLFDQYLVYRLQNPSGLRTKETKFLGRIHTKEETYLYFYCCIYAWHKYSSTLSIPIDWDKFVPAEFTSVKYKKLASDFEKLLVDVILKNELFRKTVLEISKEFVSELEEEDIGKLLIKLCSLSTPWQDKSVRALYRKFNNIPSPRKVKEDEESQ